MFIRKNFVYQKYVVPLPMPFSPVVGPVPGRSEKLVLYSFTSNEIVHTFFTSFSAIQINICAGRKDGIACAVVNHLWAW